MTAGSAPGPAIQIDGLTKRYSGRAVVDSLDLTVASGELFALLGPNGAGKTTTVEILEGYRRPDAGQVRVLGLDPDREAGRLRPRMGLMLQEGGVYRQARPREMVRLFASFYREPLDVDPLLERVGLSEAADRPYKVLSGGEKQRLGLALALVGRPELVILDEPTAGMDPAARVATRALLAGLRSDGVTVLLTTHDLADVEALADRVAVIARGRIVAEGTPASLGASGPADLVVRFARPLTAAERDTFYAGFPAPEVAGTAEGFRVRGGAADPGLTLTVTTWCAQHAVPIAELRTTGGTLEERYLALVGAADAESPK